jgi:hypothetical protein
VSWFSGRRSRSGVDQAAPIAGDGPVQRRAAELGRFLGGPPAHFEERGRLSFISLVRRGLNPGSVVIDVGCGALRAGYWLIHFLEPDCYLGIEPATPNLDAARAHLLEPGLEALKRPRFSDTTDFDLTVFGAAPDFVLLRSVWSHTSKRQVGQVLDAFAAIAPPDALLLGSYIPTPSTGASLLSRASLRRLLRREAPATVPEGSRGPKARLSTDYQGDGWSPRLIAHDRSWMMEACRSRGLVAVESPYDRFGVQVWLEVRPAPGLAARRGGPVEAVPLGKDRAS